MVILFVGHKDARARVDVLRAIHKEFPQATWICGGNRGVDGDVVHFAHQRKIPVEIRRPEYGTAPERWTRREHNHQMVKDADLVVAFFDGRQSGGTYYILTYARSQGKEIRTYPPRDGETE